MANNDGEALDESRQNQEADRGIAATPHATDDLDALARMALARTHMAIAIADAREPHFPLALVNPAFLELTGYTAEEVLGRNCSFLQGPETSVESIQTVRDALQRQQACTVQLLNFRKNGAPFWNELHLSPVHDEAGRLIYVFGSQRDVTQSREAAALAASEHRLLREIDHRAMNALALVNGITRLTASDDPKRYAASVQARVQALARAHRMLADKGWRGVALDQMLEGEVAMLKRPRVRLQGPPVQVSAGQVQPAALVLHELFDNAQAHGALSGSGELSISWHIDPQERLVCFEWRESGGPPPLTDRPKGFGWTMIPAVIKRQLSGTLAASWLREGLSLSIKAPLTVREPQTGAL